MSILKKWMCFTMKKRGIIISFSAVLFLVIILTSVIIFKNNQINDYTLIAPFELISASNKRADYEIKIKTSRAGVHNFAFRIYPKHPLMQHRMELPLVKWI